jgi:hypothetical protein
MRTGTEIAFGYLAQLFVALAWEPLMLRGLSRSRIADSAPAPGHQLDLLAPLAQVEVAHSVAVVSVSSVRRRPVLQGSTFAHNQAAPRSSLSSQSASLRAQAA